MSGLVEVFDQAAAAAVAHAATGADVDRDAVLVSALGAGAELVGLGRRIVDATREHDPGCRCCAVEAATKHPPHDPKPPSPPPTPRPTSPPPKGLVDIDLADAAQRVARMVVELRSVTVLLEDVASHGHVDEGQWVDGIESFLRAALDQLIDGLGGIHTAIDHPPAA